MKLFILAGEPSGDRIAADLVERLRERTELTLSGVGGAELIGKGLRSMFPMRELSIIGWADIIPRLPWLRFRASQVARAIINGKPDVAVFVDAQIFSAVVARIVRKAGIKVPQVLYVAPAVWAWAPERAAKLKPLFNEILAVLPFEPRVMRELDGPPTCYVGHPALGRVAARAEVPETGPLLLLPGSRDGELRRHLPMFRVVAERMAQHPRVTGLVLPTLPFLVERLEAEVRNWDVPVKIVTDSVERADAYTAAVAACTSMGTATLELALAGIPMVGTYVAQKGQVARFFKYRARYTALPNIVIGHLLVPEILFYEPDAGELVEALARELRDNRTARQLAGFAKIRALMEQGEPGAEMTDAAGRVLAYDSASAR